MFKIEQISGVFNRELWRPRDVHSGNDFVIADLQDGTSLVGDARPGDLIGGLPYDFYGRWEEDLRHGKQFRFTQYRQSEPLTRHAVVSYLRRYAPGIGPAIAGRLFDALGSDAIKTLRLDPATAAEKTNALGRHVLDVAVAQQAGAELRKLAEFEDVKINLGSLLNGRGFSHKLIDTLIKKWGPLAADRIKKDPFCLLVHDFPSCGFARCDRLYLDLGLPPHRIKRQMICLWYALHDDKEGHTWRPPNSMLKKLGEMIGSARVNMERAVKLGVRSKWMAQRRDGWIAEFEKANNELTLARKIRDLLDCKDLQWPDVDTLPKIDQHQRDTLRQTFAGAVGILAGTPGTGKTFTAGAAIGAMIRLVGSHNVAIAAPTGKAAVRITASIQSYGFDLEAKTIHRLLGVQRAGHDGKGWGFQHNAQRPLPYRYIIVDEVSMLDTDLAASLFSAIPVGTHVLLVGDPYQLPPVGHGAPLRDMIAAGLPYGELTEVKRNDGSIVQTCLAIKEGKPFNPPPAIDVARGWNWKHVEAHKPALSIMSMLGLLQVCPKGVDAIWDVQVVCAVNAKSELSRKALNKILQQELNPYGDSLPGCRFRVGDKVICTHNTLLKLDEEDVPDAVRAILAEINSREIEGEDPEEETGLGEFVANGEIGRVVSIEPKEMRVKFDLPARTVVVPLMGSKKKQADADNEADPESSGGSSVCDFDLAYAVTCHKCQGSQARIVIELIDDYNGAAFVTSREWWYTALSRAESLQITIGRLATLKKQCKRVSLRDRQTYLREMLQR